MRSKYLVIFVLGLSVVNQIDAQENEAIENIIVSASKNEQKLKKKNDLRENPKNNSGIIFGFEVYF